MYLELKDCLALAGGYEPCYYSCLNHRHEVNTSHYLYTAAQFDLD